METKVNFDVMECVETIVKFAENSHLREPFFETVELEVALLSDYLKVGRVETVLFACALAFSFERNSFSRLFEYFRLKEYQILKFRNSIELLYQKKLLICQDKTGVLINEYEVPQTVVYAVSKNLPLKMHDCTEEKNPLNLVDILEEFDKKSDDFDRDRLANFEFFDYIENLLDSYPEIPFFIKLKSMRLSGFELFFILDTVWDAIENGDNDFNTHVNSTINDFYKSKSQALRNFSRLVDNQTKLTKLNLIELSNETFRSRIRAKLSKSVLSFLKENEGLQIEEFQKENQNLIQSHQIRKKELFYNPSEISAIKTVKVALGEKQFKELRKRLDEKSLPLGISVLLHGEPGTGKTESVYQMARESKRNIFKVDISQTKSMWFGESQKLVKRIFTDYEEFKEKEKRCPILFFNEADAVIGKRKAAGSSNIADTENSIQNILLEELEKFDGILFATTNLIENLDTAFERRFLYKVHFNKPSVEIAAKIWKSKLPFLKISEAEKLSIEFPFSGGEMENIARKILMNEILNAEKPSIEMVLAFCAEEKWDRNEKKKIGF